MLRIVSFDGEKPVLEEKAFKSITDQIGPRKVKVVSIVGKFRTGKSFFLNILRNRLEKGKTSYDAAETIGHDGAVPFRSGDDAHTLGIHMWPKPFFVKEGSGEEVAVLLMDTQGMYDTSSDMKKSVQIFVISALVASLQIFNVMGRLGGDDLLSLQTFLAYQQQVDDKVGQAFMFLIRDSTRRPGGLDDGYLQHIEANASSSRELRAALHWIQEAYESVHSWAAPPCENAVRLADYQLTAGECGKEFLDSLCAASDFIARKAPVKRMHDTDLDGAVFHDFFCDIVRKISNGGLSDIVSALDLVTFNATKKAMKAANDHFMAKVDQGKQAAFALSIDGYELFLDALKNEAVKIFDQQKIIGSAEKREAGRADFLDQLTARTTSLTAEHERNLLKEAKHCSDLMEAAEVAFHRQLRKIPSKEIDTFHGLKDVLRCARDAARGLFADAARMVPAERLERFASTLDERLEILRKGQLTLWKGIAASRIALITDEEMKQLTMQLHKLENSKTSFDLGSIRSQARAHAKKAVDSVTATALRIQGSDLSKIQFEALIAKSQGAVDAFLSHIESLENEKRQRENAERKLEEQRREYERKLEREREERRRAEEAEKKRKEEEKKRKAQEEAAKEQQKKWERELQDDRPWPLRLLDPRPIPPRPGCSTPDIMKGRPPRGGGGFGFGL